MPKVSLTDRKIKSLKPVEGKRYEIMDVEARGLGVRVSEAGQRTFILKTRMPGKRDATRRRLGDYPAMSLEQARAKAGAWRTLIKQGQDPAIAEERERRATIRRQENTLEAVAEDWFAAKVRNERKGAEVERDVRKHFLSRWGKRPIADIERNEIRKLIIEVKTHAPAHARNLLGYAKRLFAWAIDAECYGIENSPAEGLKAASLIGEKGEADRILSDAELFALWRATGRLGRPSGYPYGQVYRLLLLTGLRLNEAADAHWSEFDLKGRLWVVPAARMKGKNSKARAHAVPLTADMMGIIDGVQRFKRGDFLFSTNFGQTPVWMSDKIKKRLDARMLRTLRALARIEGRDPTKVTLPRWTNHDIRRTMRTNLSKLRIAEEIREAVLAHVRPGIKGTYDLHDYLDEKREALQLWAERLREIVSPPTMAPMDGQGANVVQLHSAT